MNYVQNIKDLIDGLSLTEKEKKKLKSEMLDMFYDVSFDAGDVISKTTEKVNNALVDIQNISDPLIAKRKLMSLLEDSQAELSTISADPDKDLQNELVDYMESSQNSTQDDIGIPLDSRFRELGRAMGGVQKGLITVGGASNIGKTALLINLLDSLQCRNINDAEFRVIYVSLDDGFDIFIKRFTAIKVKMDMDIVPALKGHSQENKNKAINAQQYLMDQLQSKRFIYRDSRHIENENQFYTLVRKNKTERTIVFLDALFNLEVDTGKKEIRSENIERFNTLKRICDRFGVPLIASAEIVKSKQEDDSTSPPTKSDLMEAGKIIYNSAQIIMAYAESQKDFEEKEDGKVNIYLKIAKNKRFGGKGEYLHYFEKESGRIENASYSDIKEAKERREQRKFDRKRAKSLGIF